MDKMMDKLNGYDLWGYFFPGIIFNIITYTIYQIIYCGSISFDVLNSVGNVTAFVFLSYFLGFFLQALGRFIQRIIFHFCENPLNTFLYEKSKLLSEKEKNLLIKSIKKVYDDDIDRTDEQDNITVFYYCNNYIAINDRSEKSDKLQSLRGLSRGLISAFLINVIFITISLIFYPDKIDLANSLMCLGFCLMSFFLINSNFVSFEKHRVKNVCRFYLALRALKKMGEGDAS